MAAPSAELPKEWYAPLEDDSGFVLVQKETGQTRIMLFNPGGELNQLGPVHSNVPQVTGVATGLDTANVETVCLASMNGNAVRFLNTQDLSLQFLTPQTPGPVTAIPFRNLPGDSPTVLTHGFYLSGGQDLQVYGDVLGGGACPRRYHRSPRVI
ncbi:hypothetical protein N9230_03485 [Akkermansiaceae bacterium]|nr:hypothetical protein [Akkermansiaceae bacterium]MDB4544440.1 hypothetical protein [Akkermansiaceae bacterium]